MSLSHGTDFTPFHTPISTATATSLPKVSWVEWVECLNVAAGTQRHDLAFHQIGAELL
jgi:hypothetical protein